jgi:hypothetical protein
MGAILSLSLSRPSVWVFPGLEPGRPEAAGQLQPRLGAGPARTRTPTTPPITRVTTGTGPRHTARARDGDGATRDSDGHAHPPRHHAALTWPQPRPLPSATRRTAARSGRREWQGGRGRGGRWDADRGRLGPGYPARLGLGPGPDSYRARPSRTRAGQAGCSDTARDSYGPAGPYAGPRHACGRPPRAPPTCQAAPVLPRRARPIRPWTLPPRTSRVTSFQPRPRARPDPRGRLGAQARVRKQRATTVLPLNQ